MAARHIGLIVTGCLIGGLVAALALVVGPVAGAQEHVITGTVLLTFSASWALLATLSMLRTEPPQDVGGHRLHLHCAGSGTPTVVLESGLGETGAYWGWISTALAPDTRVCAYDRAGRGWSDPAAAEARSTSGSSPGGIPNRLQG